MAIPVVWSNDDLCHGKAEPMRRQLKFLNRFGVKGTFFVIPGTDKPYPLQGEAGKTLDKDRELCEVLLQARDDGHEFHQHGTTHDPFEWGLADLETYNLAPAVRRRYTAERFQIEATHTFDSMVERMNYGRQVWMRVFGEPSPGFRSGWGSFSGNFYRALEHHGYVWDSSRISSLVPSEWNQGRFDLDPHTYTEVGLHPFRQGNILVFPLPVDYGFHIPAEHVDRYVELGWLQFQDHVAAEAPFILVSHHHGLEANGGTGYQVHERLLTRILESGDARMTTMHVLYREIAA